MTGQIFQDLRYAVRMLMKSPAFAGVAILTLTLGIGANTAIFSVANALLFRSLPYENPERLVIVTNARGPNRRPFSYTRATFLQEHARSFAGFAPFIIENFNLTGRGEPELLPAARVGWSFFQVLGVRPAIGRSFQHEEDQPGGQAVVIISDSLWKRRFDGDKHVVGRTIALDSVDTTIIGVMPENFEFSPLGRSIDIWSSRTFETSSMTASQVRLGTAYLIAIARIGPGLQLEQAQAEMAVLDAQYRRDYSTVPDADPKQNISLNRVQELMMADVRNSVLVLFGAVGCVLLIACANVTSLLLSRAVARRREMAVRTALGASRAGIIRQLLTESILVGVLSGVLSAIMSLWIIRAVSALPPETLPKINPIRLDAPVLIFAIGLSILTGILFGLIPALRLSRIDVQIALREEGRGSAGSQRRNLTSGFLVAAQVTLSMILLVGAGLLMRSFQRLQNVTLGFNPDRILLMRIALPRSHYSEPPQISGFFDRVLTRVSTMPGVQSASVSSALPLAPSRYLRMLPEGQPNVAQGERQLLSIQNISPAYFETMGIPLLHGRKLTGRDKDGAPLVAIVNEVFARKFWPNESALGKHILLGTATTPTEIVGVSGNVKNIRLAVETTCEVFCPLAQRASQRLNLIVRTSGDPRNLARAVRAQILLVDKDQPVTDVETMEQHLAKSISQNRLTMWLLGIFSGIALVVATVGLYGLVSYSVAQRTQELGIRLALGAAPGKLQALVMFQGLLPAGIGVLLGLAGSYALSRLMNSLLYQVSATDGWTFAACAVAFILIAMLASYFPARRAARLDAADALRFE
jgi:putative ABC transport system permease protein